MADETTSVNLTAESVAGKSGRVTVEDAALMMVEFQNGAIGSFEASRFSTGRKTNSHLKFMAAEEVLLL